MSHPGMAPVFGDAKEIAPGRYQAHLEFDDGRRLGYPAALSRCPDGQKLERQFDVRGRPKQTRQAVESFIHPGPGSSRIASL